MFHIKKLLLKEHFFKQKVWSDQKTDPRTYLNLSCRRKNHGPGMEGKNNDTLWLHPLAVLTFKLAVPQILPPSGDPEGSSGQAPWPQITWIPHTALHLLKQLEA